VKKSNLLRVAVVGAAATVLPLVGATQAFGDYAPQPGDIVGIGGDTPQYAIDFALNGDAVGDAGFDQQATVNRVVSFFATPDSNGRSAYTDSVTTNAASTSLFPTDVLRSGTTPSPRVSSSGSSISALLADSGATEQINFISSASEPTAAQQTTAQGRGWGFLHVVQVASDSVQFVGSTATNAPAGLSTAEVLGIYNGTFTTWNQLPGNSGGSTDAIIPLIPPSGSSVNKTFLADLKTANGGTAPTLAGTVKTVEQNDPSAITSSTTPADAIVPFSTGRLNLWNSSYFHSPNSGTWALPTTLPVLTPGVKFLNGATPDSGSPYTSPISDYIIFRQSDATLTTPLEPGGTKNWVQTLFSNPSAPTTPFFARATGQTLLDAAGVTASYNDLGDVSSG
jgi:ABC-type phosphate transport system substrate-binding protein